MLGIQTDVDIVTDKRSAWKITVVIIVKTVFFLIYLCMIKVTAYRFRELQIIMLYFSILFDDNLRDLIVHIICGTFCSDKAFDQFKFCIWLDNDQITCLCKEILFPCSDVNNLYWFIKYNSLFQMDKNTIGKSSRIQSDHNIV